MLISANFADFLEPTIRSIFDVRSTRPNPMRDRLFNVTPSGRLLERYTGIGARRLVQPYRGRTQAEDFDQYYRTDITNYLFTDELQVERTLMEDDQFGEISRRANAFTSGFPETQEQDCVDIFANAFTDAGTNRIGESTAGADAVGLCSTAHPYSPRQSGTTQSNEDTLALSVENAKTTRIRMAKWTDDKARRLMVVPDLILVPVDLADTARQIFPQSPGAPPYEPGSAELTPNVFHSTIGPDPITVAVWNLMTDTNAWFMIDSKQMKTHLIFQERVAPTLERPPSEDNEIARWSGRMRYGLGWTHWAWLYGNNPS